jgi:hypothetical protein
VADTNNPKLQIIIELLKKGDTSGAAQELRALKGQADETGGTIEKLLGITAKTFAVIGSVSFIKSAIASATEYNKTLAALNGTLKATGQYSDEYAAQLKEQRKAISETTNASGGQLAAMQTLLVSFGATGKDMEWLTRGALDLAAVMGTDGTSAALALAKALEGQDTALTRLGFHFDENAGYTERLASLQKQLQERVGGVAAEIKKMDISHIEEMEKAWGRLKKQIGEVAGQLVAPVFSAAATGLDTIGKPVSDDPSNRVRVPRWWLKPSDIPGPDIKGLKEIPGDVPPSLPSASTMAPAQLEAQKKSLTEIAEIVQKNTLASLSGISKEREEAFINYSQELDHIDKLKRSGELKEESVSKARATATDAYLARLTEINDEETAQKLQLRELEAKLSAEGLEGLKKMQAVEQARYDMERERILANSKLETDEKTKLLGLNDAAHQAALKAQDDYLPTAKLQLFEQQLTTEAAKHSNERVMVINQEFNKRMDFYKQLQAQGELTEAGLTRLTQQASRLRIEALAPLAKEGAVEIQRNDLSQREFELRQIEREWDRRKELVEAYYDYEIERAKDNQAQVDALEEEKTAHLEDMERRKQFAASNTGDLIAKVGDFAIERFSSGMADAMVDFISGTKSAEQAFREFAASFLREIAKMIMQQIILNALRSVFSAFAGGGQAVAKAATGAQVIAAATGVTGVNDVNSPTFFPKFNVLAGEAGHEVMTVLANPQLVNWHGVVAQLGNVGSSKLAIVNAATLESLVNARKAATGMGPSLPSGVSGSAGTAGGQIDVVVTMEPGLKAEIVKNSTDNAVARVEKDLKQQSNISNAVRKLTQ